MEWISCRWGEDQETEEEEYRNRVKMWHVQSPNNVNEVNIVSHQQELRLIMSTRMKKGPGELEKEDRRVGKRDYKEKQAVV